MGITQSKSVSSLLISIIARSLLPVLPYLRYSSSPSLSSMPSAVNSHQTMNSLKSWKFFLFWIWIQNMTWTTTLNNLLLKMMRQTHIKNKKSDIQEQWTSYKWVPMQDSTMCWELKPVTTWPQIIKHTMVRQEMMQTMRHNISSQRNSTGSLQIHIEITRLKLTRLPLLLATCIYVLDDSLTL